MTAKGQRLGMTAKGQRLGMTAKGQRSIISFFLFLYRVLDFQNGKV